MSRCFPLSHGEIMWVLTRGNVTQASQWLALYLWLLIAALQWQHCPCLLMWCSLVVRGTRVSARSDAMEDVSTLGASQVGPERARRLGGDGGRSGRGEDAPRPSRRTARVESGRRPFVRPALTSRSIRLILYYGKQCLCSDSVRNAAYEEEEEVGGGSQVYRAGLTAAVFIRLTIYGVLLGLDNKLYVNSTVFESNQRSIWNPLSKNVHALSSSLSLSSSDLSLLVLSFFINSVGGGWCEQLPPRWSGAHTAFGLSPGRCRCLRPTTWPQSLAD
jgi:hypothetical protein